MSEDFKIEKNVPLIKDSRKGGKLTNPLYLIAKKMEIGDFKYRNGVLTLRIKTSETL